MTSTRQRQFSSWYHFVALLLLYLLVPVINAYLLRNKFVPNLYKDPTVCAYTPINGMPHLAYLGQMLEKEGEFGIGIFPEGLVLSWDCQNES